MFRILRAMFRSSVILRLGLAAAFVLADIGMTDWLYWLEQRSLWLGALAAVMALPMCLICLLAAVVFLCEALVRAGESNG